MAEQWEEVEVPQGRFIGWGRVGQIVTGKVLDYSQSGGRDFSGQECPMLTLRLTEPAENYRDKGTTREELAVDELVSLTAGQANLRRSLTAAQLNVGDLVRIGYSGNYKTANGEGKEFRIQVARGAAPAEPTPEPRPAAATSAAAGDIFGS